MTRHDAREQAFLVMFEKIFDDELTVSEIIEKNEEGDLIKLNGFAKTLLKICEENSAAVDEIISQYCKDWSLSRLPKVSLAVLRLSVAEIKFYGETPVGVAVNEAVEIAKKYGTPEDSSYINGVLGSVVKAV